jgi:hypothetical protein
VLAIMAPAASAASRPIPCKVARHVEARADRFTVGSHGRWRVVSCTPTRRGDRMVSYLEFRLLPGSPVALFYSMDYIERRHGRLIATDGVLVELGSG